MNKIVLSILAILATDTYAQGSVSFCKKIEGHAQTIMMFRNGSDTSRKQIESQLSQSSARPYFSNETQKWFKIILDEAYKSKWSSKNYQIPDGAYNPNARPQDYAAHFFKEEIYTKCIKEASSTSRYCSDQAHAQRTNPQTSKMQRASLNGLCLS